jgi:hypothetical protein
MNVTDLSFVADIGKPKRRCFWHVRSTGDLLKDGVLGRRLALEYLAFEEKSTGGPGYLQLIVRDMPRKHRSVEIGFLVMVSYAAGAGAHEARRISAYWDRCNADGTFRVDHQRAVDRHRRKR